MSKGNGKSQRKGKSKECGKIQNRKGARALARSKEGEARAKVKEKGGAKNVAKYGTENEQGQWQWHGARSKGSDKKPQGGRAGALVEAGGKGRSV